MSPNELSLQRVVAATRSLATSCLQRDVAQRVCRNELSCTPEFQAIYLDDVTLGGDCTDLVHEIEVMRNVADVGLNLNAGKCEIISSNMTYCGTL